jgi:hypothetical protein
MELADGDRGRLFSEPELTIAARIARRLFAPIPLQSVA